MDCIRDYDSILKLRKNTRMAKLSVIMAFSTKVGGLL